MDLSFDNLLDAPTVLRIYVICPMNVMIYIFCCRLINLCNHCRFQLVSSLIGVVFWCGNFWECRFLSSFTVMLCCAYFRRTKLLLFLFLVSSFGIIYNMLSCKLSFYTYNVFRNGNAVKSGPSVTEAAWGKVNLTAKALTKGGFESLFKQIFESSDPNEKLKKTFACYLSTSTGPVAGTLYLSTARLAFCSDRPLYFTAPSGQGAWSYYKVCVFVTSYKN